LLGNLPVNKKNASRESGIRQKFRAKNSRGVRCRVAGTATAGQLNAIYAKPLAGKFPRVKTAAAFAGLVLGGTDGFGFHDFFNRQIHKTREKECCFSVRVFGVVRG